MSRRLSGKRRPRDEGDDDDDEEEEEEEEEKEVQFGEESSSSSSARGSKGEKGAARSAPVRSQRNVRRKSLDEDQLDEDQLDDAIGGGDEGGAGRRRRVGRHHFKYEPEDDLTANKLCHFDNVTDKETEKWDKLNQDAKKLCIKAVLRLFLTKAGRGQVVTRANINEVLTKINDGDKAYTQHFTAIVMAVATSLHEVFGLGLTNGKYLPEAGKGDFFLVNRIKSPKLQEVLAELSPSDGYIGFVFVVLQILNTAPGRKLDAEGVQRHLRKIDSRFPESSGAARGRGAAARRAGDDDDGGGGGDFAPSGSGAIPGLTESVPNLLARMKKDGYLSEEKQHVANALDAAVKYLLIGPRAYAEFGLKRLAKTYFVARGEEPDASVVKEAQKQEDKLLEAVSDEEDEA